MPHEKGSYIQLVGKRQTSALSALTGAHAETPWSWTLPGRKAPCTEPPGSVLCLGSFRPQLPDLNKEEHASVATEQASVSMSGRMRGQRRVEESMASAIAWPALGSCLVPFLARGAWRVPLSAGLGRSTAPTAESGPPGAQPSLLSALGSPVAGGAETDGGDVRVQDRASL